MKQQFLFKVVVKFIYKLFNENSYKNNKEINITFYVKIKRIEWNINRKYNCEDFNKKTN